MISLIILSLIPIAIITLLLVGNRALLGLPGQAVLFATLVHEIFLVSFPIWHSAQTQFENENLMNVQIRVEDLTRVMFGESIFVLMFSLVFMVMLRTDRQAAKYLFRSQGGISGKAEERLFRMLILAGVATFSYELLIFGKSISSDLVSQVVGWVSLFFVFTPVAASAIYIASEQRWKTWMYALAVSCAAIVLFTGFLTGTRGRIMWVLSLIAISAYVFGRARILKGVILSLAIVAPLAFSFLGNYKMFAATTIVEGGNSRDLLRVMALERDSIRGAGLAGEGIVGDFAARAQGPRNSVVLYNEFDAGRSPGFRIYLGSIFFPIPRSLWPEKPLLGSTDDKEENSAVYKVIAIGHNLPYMGPLLASAHAYWEGGWGGVCALGLFTGLIWGLFFRFAQRLPLRSALLVVLCFSASLLIDGFLTMFAPLYAFPIIIWKYIMPILLFYWIALMLLKSQGVDRRMRTHHDRLRTSVSRSPS